ncbi:DNA polymerase I [bacterium BMS3Abin15]|nr:DNA polymerase I [bacterium BMS3Abin15]HDZ85697.1 DNA polymerase I [Candidatus Moranbacteria bacterium]
MGAKPKKLLLIDGNAIIHRSFHALPPLTTKKGELVNAVYGFASTLLNVINNFKPDYIAASFDLAGPTFRHKEFEGYKATRVKAPDELYEQIPKVKELVKAFDIPIYEQEGFEADDVIGTLANQSEKSKENIENIIVTGDMDALQLINKKTKVYTMRRGMSDSVLYDEKGVKEKYGLSPDQLKDYKGLRGDPSDNIPGVKGVGEKTATELLKKYKTIDGVYENLEEIKEATRDKLEKDKIQARMSKKLATIVLDVPIELDLNKAKTHEFNREKIVKLLNELNFFSLIKRLPEQKEAHSAESPLERGARKNEQFNGVKDFKYETIDENSLNDFIKDLAKQEEISLAVDENAGQFNGIAISWKTGRCGYIENIKSQISNLKFVLENEKIRKIGYDLKNIYKILNKHDISLNGIYFDVMIGAYLLNPGSKIEMKNIVLSELGEEVSTGESEKGQLAIGIDENSESVIQKICQKADYSLKLKKVLEEKIEEVSEEQKKQRNIPGTLKEILEEIEIPLIENLSQMEINGIKLNTLVFEGISKKITSKLENLEKSIYKIAGKEFNINSPQQLSRILFEELKLPADDIKKTKTGYSTASSELDKLKDKHKIIEKIEEYRELFKLKTTYLDALPKLVDEKSRIHTTFNQAVTATGRLSSSDPNLQNIPIRTDLGQLLRTAFVAEDGYRLISADYSQIDLRVVAHVSNDKKLIEAFIRGDDIHKITAAEINKVPMSQVTETMRRAAKALNFGVIYGMSVFGFSQAADIERDDAKKFIDEYMEKFSGVAAYMRDTKKFAKENEYVETLIGRRRNIPEINSPNFQVQNAAERMAINMPIQGLAADIMKLAMVAVHEEYKNNTDVKIVLQVHDEIILEVKENISKEVSKKIKEIMERVYKLKIPLIIDVKIGDSWGEI